MPCDSCVFFLFDSGCNSMIASTLDLKSVTVFPHIISHKKCNTLKKKNDLSGVPFNFSDCEI